VLKAPSPQPLIDSLALLFGERDCRWWATESVLLKFENSIRTRHAEKASSVLQPDMPKAILFANDAHDHSSVRIMAPHERS
jgi:hypothetical protein